MIEYTARIASQDTPRVGGRNLIVKKRFDPEPAETTENYLYRRLVLSRKHTFVTGDWYTLSMDVQVPEDAKGLDYYNIFDWNGKANKYGSQGDTRFVIHNGRNHITFKWGETGNKLSNAGLLLYRGFSYNEQPQYYPKYPITTSNVTLVKGTIGLESYVPAPEDVDESVSTVNNSLTALASTLLDPEQGEIHKLTAQQDQIISRQDQSDANALQQYAYFGEEISKSLRLSEDLSHALGGKASQEDLNKYVTNIIEVANKIQAQLCDMSVYGISSSGYVDIKQRNTCLMTGPTILNGGVFATPEFQSSQIRLTLRSDHDALKRQVDSLTAQLAQLQALTSITPVLDTSLRRVYDPVSRRLGISIHPDYGDWILTSDTAELHLSFEGLRAEVGRSIYIQTRKRVYLLANGHSFFGLPGTSTQGNRWLSNNTTYRFVRADATTWLVTASSSPYPWT